MKKSPSTNKSDKKARKKSTLKKKPSPGLPIPVPGVDQGKIIIKPDFDAPLPEVE